MKLLGMMLKDLLGATPAPLQEGRSAKATSVYVTGNWLFTNDWNYGRLYAYDVTNPANPIFAGTYTYWHWLVYGSVEWVGTMALAFLIVVVNALVVSRGETVLARLGEWPLLGRVDVTFEAIVAFVLLLQFSSNFAQGPFQGYVPDLVPAKQVGLASALMGVMVILGGTGTLLGPLIGAGVVIGTEHWLSSYVERWPTLLGLVFIAVVLFVAAVAGDAVNYAIGRRTGPAVFSATDTDSRLHRMLNREHLNKAHAFFERYGGKAIVLGRFVPIVRTFVPFVAGVAEMSYRSFALYNVTGALAWKHGLNPFVRSAHASIPTGFPPSPLGNVLPFTQAMPRFDVLVRKYQHRVVALVGRYIADWSECQDVGVEIS